jgi:hypothetical protein
MATDLERLLNAHRNEGRRRYAAWDGPLYDAVARGPAAALWHGLAGQDDAKAVMGGYLRLVQEAVGLGFLRQTEESPAATCFIERGLVGLVPRLLPKVAPDKRLATLVALWNLGEGLRKEPAWVDRYVNACLHRLDDLTALHTFLGEVLGPVLTPAPAAKWKGPFAVTVLDPRPFSEEFLPGRMYLAAPAVLCVQDRRKLGVEMGVLLRPKKGCCVLGLTQGLTEYSEEGDRPSVEFEDGVVFVAGQSVALPHLRRSAGHAVAQGGFIVVSAVDSQRLWIVETP